MRTQIQTHPLSKYPGPYPASPKCIKAIPASIARLVLFTGVKAIFFREKNYDADRAQNFQQFRDNLKNHDSPLIDVFLGRSETTLSAW